jgi:hypothetical protein
MVTGSSLVLQLSETEQQVINELVSAQVHFIIIGGHAVVLHGHKRSSTIWTCGLNPQQKMSLV